jgi:GMP synthase-like glutamine amidotransferase
VTIKIGILRADDVSPELALDFGQYPQMVEDLIVAANRARGAAAKAVEFTSYAVNRQQYPSNIDEVDAYIITGSKSSVYDPEPWIEELSHFVERLHNSKKKTVGICFGHQIIASALGGKVEKAAVGWGLGVKPTSLTDAATGAEPYLPQGDSSINLLYSHQDQVTVPAPGSTLLATTDICPVAMTAIGEHILSFQGHPEFSHDYAQALYRLREKNYPPEAYKNAMASLQEQEHGALVANWIIDFISS